MCDHPTQTLLSWYDHHARDLPWRVSPKALASGLRPDPYRVWLSEIMLQQTTVAAVKSYFEAFTSAWPTVEHLALAEDGDVMAAWAGLGYYARARNLLKCARVIVADYDGRFPEDRDVLQTLPGIGPYTSAAIAAIAFDQGETVVDGNVERVMARRYAVNTPLPKAKGALTELAAALTPKARPGDYAQAVMDLGATVCTPKSPACGICPWRDGCQGRIGGIAETLPRKEPKLPKPTRYGVSYVVRRSDGAYLLERRPGSGLLGGMLGWPGSDWAEVAVPTPPLAANWHDAGLQVRHTFTHFHLILDVKIAEVGMISAPKRGSFLSPSNFRPSDLPTVMRKVFDVARTSSESD
ncbi:MAG: A/G-specific adenine glycosylase [Pseudomonadota bacterium]